MIEALTDQVDAFYKRVADLPFENSDFQTLFFVVVSQQTPERAYRAAALQLHSKLKALRTAYYQLRREEVELKRLTEQVEQAADPYDRELAAIDLEEKQAQRIETQKLVADAQHTVALLQQLLDQFPAYTRAEFEAGEATHFERRLNRQRNLALTHGPAAGAAESLCNLQNDLPALAEHVPGLLAIAEAAGVLSLPAPITALEASPEPPQEDAHDHHP